MINPSTGQLISSSSSSGGLATTSFFIIDPRAVTRECHRGLLARKGPVRQVDRSTLLSCRLLLACQALPVNSGAVNSRLHDVPARYLEIMATVRPAANDCVESSLPRPRPTVVNDKTSTSLASAAHKRYSDKAYS